MRPGKHEEQLRLPRHTRERIDRLLSDAADRERQMEPAVLDASTTGRFGSAMRPVALVAAALLVVVVGAVIVGQARSVEPDAVVVSAASAERDWVVVNSSEVPAEVMISSSQVEVTVERSTFEFGERRVVVSRYPVSAEDLRASLQTSLGIGLAAQAGAEDTTWWYSPVDAEAGNDGLALFSVDGSAATLTGDLTVDEAEALLAELD